ncbi:unnamed protein product [Fraxinus pennsylvanica]|uniref:Uncharacterized protein n=1 Tax=Fraxinus pennsylvanica TaxID=56036 RepID=A0AAD1ZN89_9LAMI|nr:unnamed protein product [Fraxinus pennsylvanica]
MRSCTVPFLSGTYLQYEWITSVEKVMTRQHRNITLHTFDDIPEIDMLENVEMGEQKWRNEAYKAVKKKIGIDDDNANDSTADNQTSGCGEPQEKKVVSTEMEEFVWGLQLDEDRKKIMKGDVVEMAM